MKLQIHWNLIKKKIKYPFNATVIFYLLYFRYIQKLIISFFQLHFLLHQAIQNPAQVTWPVNDVWVLFLYMQTLTFMSGSLRRSLLPQPHWSRGPSYQYWDVVSSTPLWNWVGNTELQPYLFFQAWKKGKKLEEKERLVGCYKVFNQRTRKPLHHHMKSVKKASPPFAGERMVKFHWSSWIAK